MDHPEFLDRLERLEELEKNRIFCRHGLEHLLDVCRIAYIQVLEEQLSFSMDVVYAAGLLHDIGRVEEYGGHMSHEEASALAAEKILPECGYTVQEQKIICEAIRNHRAEYSEKNLSTVLYRADKASRCCFACPSSGQCNWPEHKKNKGVLA